MTRLTRRELLVSILGANVAQSILASCDADDDTERGRAREIEGEIEGQILGPRMDLGHALRDRGPAIADFESAPTRQVDVLVLGGGAAGLAAAWQLHRRGVRSFEVLELEASLGGTAQSGESALTRYPWGAHYLPLPLPHDTELYALLAEMGAVVGTNDEGAPIGAEHLLIREPEERVFHDGFWYRGLYLSAGSSADDRQQYRRFADTIDRFVAMRDGEGRRAFAIPVDESARDPALMALDTMSAREWLDREELSSTRLRWLVEYGCRDDYGLGLDTTSAWAAVFYHAARTRRAGEESSPLITWPEGNDALIRHMATRIGDRARTARMAVDVDGDEDGVRVCVLAADTEQREVIHAKRVISAMPHFVARRVIRSRRESDEESPGFRYGAWLVANLHLHSRPPSRGFPFAWDNVLYDSPSLGYVVATHQRGRDHGPTVWTYYLPFTDDDERAARQKLLEPSFAEWRDIILADLGRAHPGLARYISRIDVYRWGHGMIQPRPGFVWSDTRIEARAPIGRVHFAHSDLTGIALFEHAFHEGLRAANEVADALASTPTPVSANATEVAG